MTAYLRTTSHPTQDQESEMIKCRISPYNDKIFIDDTTSSKLNYMKEGYFITKEELEQRDKEIAERAFEAGDSVRIPKDIYEAYLKNEMTSEMFPRLLKSISVKPGFNDYWQQVKGEK